MRKIKTLTLGVTLFYILSFISWSENYDSVEINEALGAGVISLSFTGIEDGEKMNIRIEKVLSTPLMIVIEKGETIFPTRPQVSIFTAEKVVVDLSDKKQEVIMFPQTGGDSYILGTMGIRAKFSEDTAKLYSKLKYSKDQVLMAIITFMSQEKNEFYRHGAAVALGEIGDKRAVKSLENISANDPNPQVQQAAGEALEKILNKKDY